MKYFLMLDVIAGSFVKTLQNNGFTTINIHCFEPQPKLLDKVIEQ